MGVASWLGVGKEISVPVDAIGNGLDKLFTSEEEKLTKQEILDRTAQNPQLWQIEINKEEAKHPSIFVAGWRPFTGWTCAVAFNYHFFLQPFLIFILSVFGLHVQTPQFDMESLFTLLFGLLGLGGLRTFEKTRRMTK